MTWFTSRHLRIKVFVLGAYIPHILHDDSRWEKADVSGVLQLVHKDHKITQTNKQPLTLSDERERLLQNLDRKGGGYSTP